jgi:uncharacterized membrane protein
MHSTLTGVAPARRASPPQELECMSNDRHTSQKNAPSPEPKDTELADVVHRNIDALLEVRQEFERRKSRQDRIADAMTRFTGSLPFLYVHSAALAAWITINVGWIPGLKPFDPFPFIMLAMIASVEAIFLSTFVLISQNRAAALAEKRAELDLQINLLTEHEVTRLIDLADAIARHLAVKPEETPDVEQLKKDVAPEAVLQEIEEAQKTGETKPD